MAALDFTEQLNSVVAAISDEYRLPTFNDLWELRRQVLGDTPVRRFYVRAESGYANVGVLTDSLVLDIEGHEAESSNDVAVIPISHLSDIVFHKGPIATLPDSVGAELVVIADITGIEGAGYHWMAKTEQEQEYLIQFGKALVEAISNR